MAYADPFDPATPADNAPTSQGDDRIRELKRGLIQRLLTVFKDVDVDPLEFIDEIIDGGKAIKVGTITGDRIKDGTIPESKLSSSATAVTKTGLKLAINAWTGTGINPGAGSWQEHAATLGIVKTDAGTLSFMVPLVGVPLGASIKKIEMIAQRTTSSPVLQFQTFKSSFALLTANDADTAVHPLVASSGTGYHRVSSGDITEVVAAETFYTMKADISDNGSGVKSRLYGFVITYDLP